MNLYVDSELVAPWGRPQPGHSVKGSTSVTLKYVVHWETLLDSNNSYIAQIAAACLLLAYATLRFRHVQRSKLTKLTEHILLGECSMGKSKHDGVRSGFHWISPAQGLTCTIKYG